jgi:homoisocitrate dehydrogenase
MENEAMPLKRLCVIPGDGVGREVVPAAVRVLQALLPEVELVEAEAGWQTFQRLGNALPPETVEKIRACRAVLFGATASPSHAVPGYSSPIVAMRRLLDVYANLRPTHSYPGLGAAATIDLMIFRENTEDLYIGKERMEGETAIAEKHISRFSSARIARMAFEYAARTKKTVTIVHKANILKLTDGLWRETCLETARDYPQVKVNEGLVDSVAYQMVLTPARYQLLLCPNLYGDILSDLASGLGGGLGLAPSLSLGDEAALAEPVHGAAPDIAGKGIANPIGAILSLAMMMRHWWQEESKADMVEKAVGAVLAAGGRTADIARAGEKTLSTAEMTAAIIDQFTP